MDTKFENGIEIRLVFLLEVSYVSSMWDKERRTTRISLKVTKSYLIENHVNLSNVDKMCTQMANLYVTKGRYFRLSALDTFLFNSDLLWLFDNLTNTLKFGYLPVQRLISKRTIEYNYIKVNKAILRKRITLNTSRDWTDPDLTCYLMFQYLPLLQSAKYFDMFFIKIVTKNYIFLFQRIKQKAMYWQPFKIYQWQIYSSIKNAINNKVISRRRNPFRIRYKENCRKQYPKCKSEENSK